MGRTLLEKAKIAASQISFSTVFNDRLQLGPEPIEELAMEVTSTGDTEQYNWLGDVPGLTEWLDDRKLSRLRAEKYSLTNKDWSSGIVVDRNEILDDKLGMVRPRIQMLADKARKHPGKILVECLLNGFSGTAFPSLGNGKGYDGVLFFSASHQDGAGPTQSNTSTNALTHANFNTARVAMQSLVDEESYPLDIEPNLLIVGPSKAKTAREIVQSKLVVLTAGDGAVENVLADGDVRVMVSKRLVGSYANYWFLADTSQPVKPLILQRREPVRFDAVDSMDSEDVFMRRRLKYGASDRKMVGYGLWQFIYGSTGAG